ncbi:MAG: metal-dependent transcriptional regulator [Actinomycetota bacterium]
MATTEPRRSSDEGTLRPETVKHYLETIFYIQFEEDRVRPGRVAEWIGLRPPTVSVTLHRLERDGWIHVESDRTVSLTDEGMALASGVVRVHRLLERWLTDVLGFDWASADNHAQEIAPGMSDAVAERLDEHLGHPSTCPHGNVIPGSTAPYGELVSLADLPPGAKAHVRRISEVAEHDAPDLLRRLDGHGLVTGAEVIVAAPDDSSDDALTVEIGDRTMALGISTARLIWVERGR